MGFTYRKSKNIGSGVRLNTGKKSVGLSSGVKGARVSVNSNGRAGISLSIPGTGIRYRKSIKVGHGGLLAGVCNFFIALFQIGFLLTWWLLKLVLWLMYVIAVYAYRGISFLVRSAISKMRKCEVSGENIEE